MWHALKAELSYFRAYVLGSLGIALGVITLISVIFYQAGEEGPSTREATGIRGMFLVMAPMIVSFIIQGLRSEEKRPRLLLMGPLTPRQLAGVTVLLPIVLFGVSVVLVGLFLAVNTLVTGTFERDALDLVFFVGGQMFTYSQLGLVAQEAVAAHRQRRSRAAAAGWTFFVVVMLVVASMYVAVSMERLTWNHVLVGHLLVLTAAVVVSVKLYVGRNDFTR